MTDDIRRGPYVNDDGDYWYPVDAWSWNEAQYDHAREARMDGDYVSRYIGREEDIGCHDHEDWDAGMTCCRRTAYHFIAEDPLR